MAWRIVEGGSMRDYTKITACVEIVQFVFCEKPPRLNVGGIREGVKTSLFSGTPEGPRYVS